MGSMSKEISSQKLENSIFQHHHIQDGLVYVQTSPQRYVVKDPGTGRYFRLSATIVRIMHCLDGTKSSEAIAHELHVDVTRVQYVVNQLAGLRLLHPASPVLARSGQVPKGPYMWMIKVQRYLLLRKDIITGDGWMDRIYLLLRLKNIFHPWFGILLLMIYTGAMMMYIYYSSAIQETFGVIARLDAHFFGYLALGWLFYCVIGILHELAHGFACKHFGGRVRAIGVALYFFRPAWYCDVTDAWMFTRRYERLVTHAAGIALDFLLTSLALFLLPFALHREWLMIIITLTFLVGGLRTLANFNPLIKLDGYYILADLLGIENLRSKSFYMLFSYIRRAFCAIGLTRKLPGQQRFSQARWEKLFLALYGFISLAYTTLLLSYLGIYYTALLSSYIGLWSWLLFCLAIVLFVVFPCYIWWYLSGSRYSHYNGN